MAKIAHCESDNQARNFFVLQSSKVLLSDHWSLFLDDGSIKASYLLEILRNIFVISTFLSAIPDCHSDQMCLLVLSTKAESRDTNYERKYETSDVVLKVLIPLGTISDQKIFYLESVKIGAKNVQNRFRKEPEIVLKGSQKGLENVKK